MTDLFHKDLTLFDESKLRMGRNKDGEVVYCLSDVLSVLTGTKNPRHEMWNVRKSLERQGIDMSQIMEQFKFTASNGKCYHMLGGTREQIFRVLQEIRSPRLAPFKQWLAQAGSEYLHESENPDLAIQHGYRSYRKRGLSAEQAMTRAKSVMVRNMLTEKWADHGITSPRQFALLTNRAYENTFGKTAKQMKDENNLPDWSSLRDHMNLAEMTVVVTTETATSMLIDKHNPNGYVENMKQVDRASEVGRRVMSELLRVLSE